LVTISSVSGEYVSVREDDEFMAYKVVRVMKVA
jgi:hypothetical protein